MVYRRVYDELITGYTVGMKTEVRHWPPAARARIGSQNGSNNPWRIHGAAVYGNMDPINIPQMLPYIPYMDPMGNTSC